MKGRNKAPTSRDPTPLPGGGKLGQFWDNCKRLMRCGRSPYDRLLSNSVLRADYRCHGIGTRRQQANLNGK